MEATNERQIEIIEYIENWYHSSEIPAGKACNQIPTIFKSKNGVASRTLSGQAVNGSLNLYVVLCKSSTSKVKYTPPQYKGFQMALY